MPRVFDDPITEPRSAAGGRSSNIIISVRPERPSSSVRPKRNIAKTESANRRPGRRQRVAVRGSVC